MQDTRLGGWSGVSLHSMKACVNMHVGGGEVAILNWSESVELRHTACVQPRARGLSIRSNSCILESEPESKWHRGFTFLLHSVEQSQIKAHRWINLTVISCRERHRRTATREVKFGVAVYTVAKNGLFNGPEWKYASIWICPVFFIPINNSKLFPFSGLFPDCPGII